MRKIPLAAFAALLFACPVMAQEGPGLLPWQDAERVTNGAQVYDDYCAACHGVDLEGQENWQERDTDGYLPAPPHDETGHTWHHPDPLLVQIVTVGTEAIVGGNYRSNMIGFGDQLSADEILDVMAYIKSTWPAEVIDIHNQINERAAAMGN